MKYSGIYKSPIGDIYVTADNTAVLSVGFKRFEFLNNLQNNIIKSAIKQLNEYFLGRRKVFSLPLNPLGTDFQKAVWKELQNIPYGETRTYKDIAAAVGNPKACRAIGNANNKNPIGIVIPCHRVIGSNNKLIGYAGGLDKKQMLLNLENENKCKFM